MEEKQWLILIHYFLILFHQVAHSSKTRTTSTTQSLWARVDSLERVWLAVGANVYPCWKAEVEKSSWETRILDRTPFCSTLSVLFFTKQNSGSDWTHDVWSHHDLHKHFSAKCFKKKFFLFCFLQHSATRLPLRFWQVHWECLRSFVSDPGSRSGSRGLWELWCRRRSRYSFASKEALPLFS